MNRPAPRRPALPPARRRRADTYRVGTAQVDITPTHPIRLNGFGFRRTESEGVYHRICARALAIEDESKDPFLLITVDVLGIPDDIRAELAQRFAKKANLQPERLAITATHTHTGPMLKGANDDPLRRPDPEGTPRPHRPATRTSSSTSSNRPGSTP